MPEDSGWIPSVSHWLGPDGYLLTATSVDVKQRHHPVLVCGLEWTDVFVEGNSFGMAVGQPTFISDIDVKGGKNESDYVGWSGYAWEFFYKFQVTDNITVTPAIHYLSEPSRTARIAMALNAMSGLIKTTFKF